MLQQIIKNCLLGGGGYTIKNVARLWCYETSIALNIELASELPETDFKNYFHPNTTLHIRKERTLNKNTQKSLQKCIQHAYELMRNIQFVPSVQLTDTPDLLLKNASDNSFEDVTSSNTLYEFGLQTTGNSTYYSSIFNNDLNYDNFMDSRVMALNEFYDI